MEDFARIPEVNKRKHSAKMTTLLKVRISCLLRLIVDSLISSVCLNIQKKKEKRSQTVIF